MARSRWPRGAVLAVTLTLAPIAASGQLNTFEGTTTEGWLIHLLGPGAPEGTPPAAAFPVVVPTGGPGGVGDGFLQLTGLGGSGPGSRLMAISVAGWSGNYLANGITSVRANAINLGTTDLFLRFLIEDPVLDPTAPAPPSNIAISAVPIMLAVGSGWQTIEFPLFGAQGLTAIMGSLNAALSNVTAVRIFHGPTPVNPATPLYPPPPVNGRLGLDNITAVATVPEPSTVALFATGALGLLLARRRRSGR